MIARSASGTGRPSSTRHVPLHRSGAKLWEGNHYELIVSDSVSSRVSSRSIFSPCRGPNSGFDRRALGNRAIWQSYGKFFLEPMALHIAPPIRWRERHRSKTMQAR